MYVYALHIDTPELVCGCFNHIICVPFVRRCFSDGTADRGPDVRGHRKLHSDVHRRGILLFGRRNPEWSHQEDRQMRSEIQKTARGGERVGKDSLNRRP